MTDAPLSVDATRPEPAAAPSGRPGRALRAWWRQPRPTWWLAAGLGLGLFLHKPSALLTPQLWAEDGSIFLVQQDLLGLHAFLVPYMGYLHALPRLIAWAAAHLLDPAHWPAFYNGAAFAIWLGVVMRMFSRRLDLPGKPGLALALLLGALTPEVLFNITNLQWLTAFVLIQQLFLARPATRTQRAGDWLLLGLVGLTGPFAIIVLPLFAWRWWRHRHADNLATLLLVAACAGVQAGFLLVSRPHFAYQAEPWHAGPAVVLLARRLLVWPLLGDRLSQRLPAPLVAAVGGAVLVALFAWSMRPHPRRSLRAVTLAALALVVLACAYGIRFDTWPAGSFTNADRYFFIPRVLLFWLVIWELDASPRPVAWSARILALALAVAGLRSYVLPAPPDFHWAAHCAPLRRGEAADIPTLPAGWMFRYPGRPAPHPAVIPTRPPAFLTFSPLLCSAGGGCALQLQVTQGPARFRATGLPPGLALNGASGWITGRPARPGEFTARIVATNSRGSTAGDFTFQVEARTFFGRVSAPVACAAGAPVELRFAAYDGDKKLDFVDLTDLTTGKFLARLPAAAGERQSWQGRYPATFSQPGRHRISLRFVRFDPAEKSPYSFFDQSVEITVTPAPTGPH